MHVIVMGAGVVGVTTAWCLRQHGHDVTVIDRQAKPAAETSHANGGQISVSHAEPWANPSAPLKVLRWLFKEDAPLLIRLRADPAQWRWCLRFLLECTPARTRSNIRQIVALGLYSRRSLGELRQALDLHYDDLQKGILHFYTSETEFAAAREPARVMRDHGCDVELIDADEVVRIEPALRFARAKVVAGSMTHADESGDACVFTRKLAEAATARGVEFKFNTTILGLDQSDRRNSGLRVRTTDGDYATIRADSYVVCLGCYSGILLNTLGVALQIYPAKGYSATLPIRDPERAYTVSLTDDEYKLVFSRLGNWLRVAGTAELNGFDLELNPGRTQAIVRRLLELFPGVCEQGEAQYWTGLRPATPSNVPCVGRSQYQNLYLNTGHGTLGWTHSCGSGRALADIVGGRQPQIEFSFTEGDPMMGSTPSTLEQVAVHSRRAFWVLRARVFIWVRKTARPSTSSAIPVAQIAAAGAELDRLEDAKFNDIALRQALCRFRMRQGRVELFERPVYFAACDHQGWANTDAVVVGVLAQDAATAQRIAVAPSAASVRVKLDGDH
jgi:D-amino-acid dehydrogenase